MTIFLTQLILKSLNYEKTQYNKCTCQAHTTIRSIIVAPKDKDHPPGQMWCSIPTDMPCHDCEASYIGETERPSFGV